MIKEIRILQNEELTDLTKTHYNKLVAEIGEQYSDFRWHNTSLKRSHYMHTKRTIEYAFENYIGNIDNLLEIGCGPGTWTDICLNYANQLTAYDISEEMIKVVKAKYSHLTNINYICGDYVTNKQQVSNHFDTIFSARALEYMSDKNLAVRNSCKYLKKGGHLAIITKNPMWRDKIREQKRKIFSQNLIQKKHTIQTAWIYWKDLAKIFKDNNLTDITVKPVVVGSYLLPFNNYIGIKICNIIYKLISKKEMKEKYDSMSESYIILGKKK